MKIPVEILKLKSPDGVERYKAIISFHDAIADTSQSGKLIQIQDEYVKLVAQLTKLWKAIEQNRQNMANSRNQWKLADMINSLVKFVENEGYLLTNAVDALSRDVGMSKSQLNYLRKFRARYPSIDKVSDKINWSKYRELMDFSDEKMRKKCEALIIEGKIKTDGEIRTFKRKMKTGRN
jgi:hypothetical protein